MIYNAWILTESEWQECTEFNSKNRKAALKLIMDTYHKTNGNVKVRLKEIK